MIWKIIIIFLCAMVLVGMIGKLIFPPQKSAKKAKPVTLCNDCGRPVVGKNCACKVRS